MSLDTQYRPTVYRDVLGQEATVKVLRGFVRSGKGNHQSYLFVGPYGSGKTTLGRILARALLCDDPVDGEPCDQCRSCRSMLEKGVSDVFVEVDAATNSGKESIRRIVENLQYVTLSGKLWLYLFDEAHQLSRDALDALLKPLEEGLLVCIFCTTEPEKMRETIFSRCAPAFVVRPPTSEQIAERLAYICSEEGIEYEAEMLRYIAAAKENHVRDAIKAVEGISMLGPVNPENVRLYLGLDLNDLYFDVLESIQTDQKRLVDSVRALLPKASPSQCYQRLSEMALTAYLVRIGATSPPLFLDADRLSAVAEQHQEFLLTISQFFSERPARPTPSMFLCDALTLHQGYRALPATPPQRINTPTPPEPSSSSPAKSASSKLDDKPDVQDLGIVTGAPVLLNGGVYRDNRLVRRTERASEAAKKERRMELEPDEFCKILRMSLAEMDVAGLKRGSTGRADLGSD